MPLHIQISDLGHIEHVGPTLTKLCNGKQVLGRRFLEVFEVRRPAHIDSFTALRRLENGPIKLLFRDGPSYLMKGLFVQLESEHRILINLSLGVHVVDAVSDYDLRSADFAHSDPTVDMLYLIEAKSVALDESKRLNARLEGAKVLAEEQAYTDMLTGLKNRRASEALLAKLEQSSAVFGLMHLDLDYFKQVNDTFGHAAGDHVLRHVAGALKAATRAGDLIARVGGDEFVLVFCDCVDMVVLDRIARRIIELLEEPILFEGQICRISASIGATLSSFYEHARINTMMNDADQALYISKDRGRARHTFFEPQL
ncbi:MAG: GGDEF domain-containing protein [Litoreibacter sp.]